MAGWASLFGNMAAPGANPYLTGASGGLPAGQAQQSGAPGAAVNPMLTALTGGGGGTAGLGQAATTQDQGGGSTNPLAAVMTDLSGGAVGPQAWGASQLPLSQQAAALSYGQPGGGGGMSPQDTLAALLAGTMT